MPDDYIVFLQEHEFDISAVEDDPINFRQALESSKSQEWIDAMNEEIKSMKDNDVWDLVPLPEGVKPIGCVTPQTRGSVDYPSTRGIQVDVELPDATSENREESPLYGELYPMTSPA